MGQPWKRFFLMVIGTIFVLNIFNDGPLQPSNTEERVIMFLTKVALAVLGVWMIRRGVKMTTPPPT